MRRTKIVATPGPVSSDMESVQGAEVITRVIVGGLLKSNKGINLPGTALSVSALTDKDKSDALHGLEIGVDYMALPWGVKPILSKHYEHLEDMLSDGLGILKHRGFVEEGDVAVVIFGTTLMPGATDIMKVHNF